MKQNQDVKFRLRYESVLKSMPADIRTELARRKLAEIDEIKRNSQQKNKE